MIIHTTEIIITIQVDCTFDIKNVIIILLLFSKNLKYLIFTIL